MAPPRAVAAPDLDDVAGDGTTAADAAARDDSGPAEDTPTDGPSASVSQIGGRSNVTLPLFDGFRVPRARLSFGGALDIRLTSDEDVALFEALGLGATATVTVAVDGHERELTLSAKVTNHGAKYAKTDEVDSIVATHRLVVNDFREGDDDPADDGD